MVLWSKWHRPGGHRVYEAVIVLCSLTLPLGAVTLYAVCECGISWSYILFYIDLYIVKTLKKIFLSETTRPRALIFGM